jgi:hypothetical protein
MNATITIILKNRAFIGDKKKCNVAVAGDIDNAFAVSMDALTQQNIQPENVKLVQYDIDDKFAFAYVNDPTGWTFHQP